MNIELSESQKNAVEAVRKWLKDPTAPLLFRLYGYAGTGKTTIIKSLVDDLGLAVGHDVLFATLTGKAAQVMSRINKLPCQTIHSLIYTYIKPNETVMSTLETKIKNLQELDEDPAIIQTLKAELATMRSPNFVLNPESNLYEAELLVLDECSMISENVAQDLLSFGKRILLIGDPGQLPPINGKLCGGFGDEPPNIFLEEIHRQALESPILLLATKARKGQLIKNGLYGPCVMHAPFSTITPKDLINFDQVICGTHVNRFILNNEIRAAKGFESNLPTSPDEKIILTRNYGYANLLNGQFIRLNNVTKRDETRFYADIITEDGDVQPQRSIYSGHFLQHKEYDENRLHNEYSTRSKAIECDFAEAITCHKAQGSQWTNVAVIDDWKSRDTRNRWLYTAITRASDGLMIFTK